MVTKKKRTTGAKKAPQPSYPPVPCAFCNAEHRRKGKYCSDACKQKDYRRRLELKQSSAAEIAEETTVTLRHETEQEVQPAYVERAQFEMMVQAVRLVVREELSNIQVTAIAGVQLAPPAQTTYRATVTLPDDPTIELTKVKSVNGDVTTNFLRSVSAVAGVNLTQPDPRTIKINGQDTSVAQGIKRMEVPQFAPPSFDDDEL